MPLPLPDLSEFKKLQEISKKTQAELERNYLIPLTNQRKIIVKDEKEYEKLLKECKEKKSMIDCEIAHLIKQLGLNEYEINGIKAFVCQEMAAKVIDVKKMWDWIKKENRFDLLRSDFVKRTEINKLIDKGITPDGIAINTWESFKIKEKANGKNK